MSNRPEESQAVAARRSRQRTDMQRDMVIEYFQKTGSVRDIEAAFNQFVAPGMRHMLFGGTPGHDAEGNRLDGEA
tara:strand:- start:53 stop:277 length:225 start_codon:yes stop_codon:yes gene_type:complete